MKPSPIVPWKIADSAPAWSGSLLLARFAAFYEELATIKRCQQEGKLDAYLAPGEAGVPLAGSACAARVGARLLLLLREQHLEFQREAGVQQIKLHQTALYVMAALADEILLLELSWPGGDHWRPVLLERQMFRTTHSGLVFFQLADKLIAGHGSDPLHADLAGVFLLALQLGFKGLHRTADGDKALDDYRQRLFRVASGQQARLGMQPLPPSPHLPGFLQAYQHNMADGEDRRLAPVTAWRRKLKLAALAYLALSTVAWVVLVYPL